MKSPSDLQPTEAFGLVLRQLRLAQGLSQEKLAFEADLERNFISLLELGQRSPTLGTIFKLAKALQMKPSALVVETEALCA
jgi:transcriptional regulator with XRE-family HTH domain